MKMRGLTFCLTIAGALVASGAAHAAGYATGSVNMRTGPSTAYPVITTIPAGARVDIRTCTTWCSVNYRGLTGWASARYIAAAPGPRYRAPMYRPPVYAAPPAYYYPGRPVYRQPGFYGGFGFGFRTN